LKQDFPLEEAELILIGSNHQIAHWKATYVEWPRFQRVRMLPVEQENSHYWRLKNKAAEYAEADILALIDCDGLPWPHWLSSGVSAIHRGADVSVGPSLYRTENLAPDSPWMMAAALPSWSFALAFASSPGELRANALVAHNLIIRRALLLQHPFRTLKKSFGSSLLFFDLERAAAKFSYQPGQKVAHGMNFQCGFPECTFGGAGKHMRDETRMQAGRASVCCKNFHGSSLSSSAWDWFAGMPATGSASAASSASVASKRYFCSRLLWLPHSWLEPPR
jgi:hypothetical protein